MAGAAYLAPPQPPPLFTATAGSILDETKRINSTTQSVYDQVVANVKPEAANFANTLEPILIDDNESSAARRIMTFYQHVSPDESLRDASTKCEEALDDFNIETRMRDDIFALIDAAYASRSSQNLDTEPLHLLEKERQKYIRNGLLLPAGPLRDRFKAIQKRLSQLCIQCQKILNEDKGAIWFRPEELEGIPADDVNIDELEKGVGENEGKVRLTFKYNHFFPLMKHAIHENTRRTYVIAEANKVRFCSMTRPSSSSLSMTRPVGSTS